jgi:hypothetical protein
VRKAKELWFGWWWSDHPRIRTGNVLALFHRLAPLPFADAFMKPSDYPLHSVPSRAAARALLERRLAGLRRIDVVSSVPRPGANGVTRIGTWIEGADGSLFRFSTIPAGMTIDGLADRTERRGWNVKPSDYPLCSSQSRAAARMLLEQRPRTRKRVEVILGCHDLHAGRPTATEWREDAKDGKLCRIIGIQDGMTLADGLRAIGGYSPKDLAWIAASHPEPLVTGSMLMLRR